MLGLPSTPNTGAMPPPHSTAPPPQATQQYPPPQPYAQGAGYVPSQVSEELRSSEHYAAILDAMKKAPGAVVQQAVRDNWRECFLGSEFQIAYTLGTTISAAPVPTLKKVVRDFGRRIVQDAGPEIFRHCATENIDQGADFLLVKASPKFLDRALAQRLETITARDLVNALARAERLGYDIRDVVDERTYGGAENVIPSAEMRLTSSDMPERAAAPPTQLPSNHTQNPSMHRGTAQAQGTTGGLQHCTDCRRPCTGAPALNYHVKKKLCNRSPFSMDQVGRSICVHCGTTFISTGGVSYHHRSKVCGEYNEAATASQMEALRNYAHWVGQASLGSGGYGQPHQPQHQQASDFGTPRQATPNNNNGNNTPISQSGPVGDDSLTHLTPGERQRYMEAVMKTEEKFGAQMREAMQLPEPQSTDTLARLKNRYNTKQSTTRKQFRIRLRQSRTKEDIEAERIRLLRIPNAQEVWQEQERAAKKLQESVNVSGTQATSLQQGTSGTGPRQEEISPRKRIPLSEMGGLSGSAGSAETMDPTALPTFQDHQPRGLVQTQTSQAPGVSTSSAAVGVSGAHHDPMEVDEEGSSNKARSSKRDESSTDEDSSSEDSSGEESDTESSGDDEDIQNTH